MITDQDTNFVYFSSQVKERPALKDFWLHLKKTLERAGISYSFIQNTNDLWCRDYMPVQVARDKYIQFTFDPSYYKFRKYQHLLTDTNNVKLDSPPFSSLAYSPLLLDGGNLVRSRHTAIVTDRIFKENKEIEKQVLLAQLKKELAVTDLHVIPALPYEASGHADGMVRLLDDQTLLVARYHTESPSWQAKYQKALEATGLTLLDFPGVTTTVRNEQGEVAALGCYINFACIGDVILFPRFDLPEDKEALQEVKRIYKDYQVLPVPAADLAMACGVLNCATWNVKL